MAARRPLDTLNANRLAALRYADRTGRRRLRALLARSQKELEQRLKGVKGDTFTAVQMKAALVQVRALLGDLQGGLARTVVDSAGATALRASKGALAFFDQAEQQFRGTAGRPIAVNKAMVFDRAVNGARSSVLNRLSQSPRTKEGLGIIKRYGARVVEGFERTLATRMVTKAPWAEVRQQLVEQSTFLKGQPMSWAERILRTEVMYAHNLANLDTMRAVDEQVGGGSVKILAATFDDRTGADSYAVHGQIRRLDEPFEWWGGDYMNPPNRPDDREVVVPHRIGWPIPAALKWRSDGEVAARWAEEKRKGAPPPRPRMTTIPLEQFSRG